MRTSKFHKNQPVSQSPSRTELRNLLLPIRQTPKQCVKSIPSLQESRYSVFIVNFEQISDIVLIFLLLTLNK